MRANFLAILFPIFPTRSADAVSTAAKAANISSRSLSERVRSDPTRKKSISAAGEAKREEIASARYSLIPGIVMREATHAFSSPDAP